MTETDPLDKLERTKDLLIDEFSINMKSIELRKLHGDLKITFPNDNILYITFNTANEYSYQLIFSQDKLDRCRFDNFDKKWKVISQPHHFHPRYTKEGFSSPMKGQLRHDIPILIDLIQGNKLLDSNIRFD